MKRHLISSLAGLMALALLTQVSVQAQGIPEAPPIVIQSNRHTAPISTWDHERAARIATENSATSVGSTSGGGSTSAATNTTGANVRTNQALVAQPRTVVTGGQPPCAAQAVAWSVGGATCSANTPVIISGESEAVSDVTAPTTGAATYACNAGAATVQPGATCAATCAGGPVSWANGSNVCAATAPSLTNGQSVTVASSNGIAGSANLSCAATGVMTLTPVSCTPPAPVRDWFVYYTCCDEFKGQLRQTWFTVHISQTAAQVGGGHTNTINAPFEDYMYYYIWVPVSHMHVPRQKSGVVLGAGYSTNYSNCLFGVRNHLGENRIGFTCVRNN